MRDAAFIRHEKAGKLLVLYTVVAEYSARRGQHTRLPPQLSDNAAKGFSGHSSWDILSIEYIPSYKYRAEPELRALLSFSFLTPGFLPAALIWELLPAYATQTLVLLKISALICVKYGFKKLMMQ